MPDNGPFRLLVPAARRDAVASALDALPRALWSNWHESVLQQDENLGVLATAHAVDANALATINGVGADAALPAGTHLLLPGSDESSRTQALGAKIADIVESSTTHVVHAGDTLWSIARGARVRLADLLSWNGLSVESTLHLGQRLRLHAGEGGSSAAAAGAR